MLNSSPDFTVLTAMGDVTIFGFLPGAAAAGCPV
jgi:septum formation inhibitor MinC